MKNVKSTYKIIFTIIIGLLFVACFSFPVLARNTTNPEETDLAGPENALQDAMDKLFTLIDTIEKEKGLSDKEKSDKIYNNINSVRWGPEKDNYFWIIDLNGKTIGEPICIDLEGKSITNYTIIDYKTGPDTEKIFADVINTCNEKGQAFFQYISPECRRDPADAKIALARLYAYKKWIIITGIYRDTIEAYQEPVETDFFVPVDDPGREREIPDENEPASGT